MTRRDSAVGESRGDQRRLVLNARCLYPILHTGRRQRTTNQTTFSTPTSHQTQRKEHLGLVKEAHLQWDTKLGRGGCSAHGLNRTNTNLYVTYDTAQPLSTAHTRNAAAGRTCGLMRSPTLATSDGVSCRIYTHAKTITSTLNKTRYRHRDQRTKRREHSKYLGYAIQFLHVIDIQVNTLQ